MKDAWPATGLAKHSQLCNLVRIQEAAGDVKNEEAPWPPSVLVRGCLHKSGKRWRSACISLDGLLDYDEEDKEEGAFEINLFAENFSEMLSRDYGLVILSTLYSQRQVFVQADEKSGSISCVIFSPLLLAFSSF